MSPFKPFQTPSIKTGKVVTKAKTGQRGIVRSPPKKAVATAEAATVEGATAMATVAEGSARHRVQWEDSKRVAAVTEKGLIVDRIDRKDKRHVEVPQDCLPGTDVYVSYGTFGGNFGEFVRRTGPNVYVRFETREEPISLPSSHVTCKVPEGVVRAPMKCVEHEVEWNGTMDEYMEIFMEENKVVLEKWK